VFIDCPLAGYWFISHLPVIHYNPSLFSKQQQHPESIACFTSVRRHDSKTGPVVAEANQSRGESYGSLQCDVWTEQGGPQTRGGASTEGGHLLTLRPI
jgi:hypothetical protein